MTRQFFALALASAILACTPAAQTTPAAPIAWDEGFQGTRIAWRNAGSDTIVFYKAIDDGGRVKVCGAVTSTGAGQIKALQGQVLRSSYITSGRTVLVDGLSYFTAAEPNTPVGEVKANCAITEVPWTDAMATTPLEMKTRDVPFYVP